MSLFRFFFPQKEPGYLKNKHNIPANISLQVTLNKHGLVATSNELPGLVTNAKNPEELLKMVNDAVLEYFNISKFESDYIFDTLNMGGEGVVSLKQTEDKRQLA